MKSTTAELLPEEIETGRALQERFVFLRHLRVSVRSDVLKANYEAARAAYLLEPSEPNLGKLKQAVIERHVLGDCTEARYTAAETFKRFYSETIIPWAKAVGNRLLQRMKEAASEVELQENRRHLELIGKPLRNSDIVDAARKPANQIQEVSALVRNVNVGRLAVA